MKNGPPIKNVDGTALQKFSVLLTSCKNTLKEIGCHSKMKNPDSLHEVVERVYFPLRQKWRDVADDITCNKQREVTSLCDNCLQPGDKVQFCPKSSYCKIPSC